MAKIKRSLVLLIGVALGMFIMYIYFVPSLSTNSSVANDREYLSVVQDAVKGAKESVHIIIFEVKYYPNRPNSDEMKLLYELVNAVKRGVEVKIVTDEFYTNDEGVKFLKDNGIDIIYDPTKKTTHAKLLIIDGKIVIVGSTNWSYYSIDKNHEANALIKSTKLAGEFEKYFQNIWEESK